MKTTTKRLVLSLALAASTPAAAQTLLSETFSYPDGVVTSEKAFYGGACPCSPVWDLTSGTLYASSGRGWSGAPSKANNSAIFRMKTKAKTYQNVAVSFRLLNQGLVSVEPAQSYDGVHVWLRYGAEEGPLYALSINRRDNVVLVKKKLAGGSSNGGTYATIGQTARFAVPYKQWVTVKATAVNNADGSVQLELFANGTRLLSVRDASSAIRSAGAVGVRGDNANFMIDDLAVTSLDGAGSGAAATPPAAGAPAATAVTAADVTQTSANVTWTTDKVSHSQVEYGLTTAYGAHSAMSTATGLYHSSALSGLQAGKTYHYRVKSKDDATGLTGVSGDFTFTTKAAPVAAAPVATAVTVSNVTGSGANVAWTTDKISHSQVEYGLTTAYGAQSAMSTATGLYHSAALTGLQAGKTYHYRVKSKDDATGLTGVSGDYTFTTPAPVVAAPVASAVQASGLTSTGANITWTTDKVSHSQVEYGPTAAYGAQSPMSSATGLFHSMGLSGLQPGVTYHYRVKSKDDASGQTGVSGDFTFTTPGAAPAPATSAVISGVRADAVTISGATVYWNTTTVSHSQVEYGLTAAYGQQTGQSSATGAFHSMPVSGLKAGTVYHYRVKSLNPATGKTDVSGDFTFKTAGAAGA